MADNPQVKRCGHCGEIKPLTDFYARSDQPGKHRSECKPCLYAKQLNWKAKNKDRAAYLVKMRNVEKKYGITRQKYAAMLEASNGVCAICCRAFEGSRGPKSPAVDHCHTTRKVRGLICNGCNVGLGNFRDNPEFLRAAIKYLEDGA